MRALPSLSLEYFGSTAFGNTAGPAGAAGAAASLASFFAGFAAAAFGSAGAAGAAAAGAAAGVASAPHCALRKSFHFWPLSVPAVLAAWYFALHSCAVSACAGEVATEAAKAAMAAAHNNLVWLVIPESPYGGIAEEPHPNATPGCDNAPRAWLPKIFWPRRPE